jgi:hypothetical protein
LPHLRIGQVADPAQLRILLGNVVREFGERYFFRKGKLGLKVAIKIPFFVEIEVNFETDWNRRP